MRVVKYVTMIKDNKACGTVMLVKMLNVIKVSMKKFCTW